MLAKTLIAALTIAAFTATITHAQDSRGRDVTVVAEGLDYPWNIASDGGRIFLTEKAGNVLILTDGRMSRGSLITTEPIETDGGRGLLGMALAPDFAISGTAYFYHSTASGNRVIAARQEGEAWREVGVLLDGIPGHRLYNGGRIEFGPDGLLYVTTGWTENPDAPQDVASLAGKILRIQPDGGIPGDNPFPGSPVWTLGHRNPQGIAWDEAGRMFAAEHGQSALDEVNLIEKGGNYGWPLAQGDERREGLTPPLTHSGTSTWAPSGIAVSGDKLFMAALGGRGIEILSTRSGERIDGIDVGERVRDIAVVDGAIYAITTNRSPRASGPSRDRLLRISPD
ncbi:PQQ-dependent sugar dehydrogenase [Kaistia terrae]|uniref:PQQ-dependent sugar dehydrogenase n=1 Tax=Kaistia terrae TaxID=537017 RepID=A0ABW0Q541_9HYPH|nr:PQQ-dependent sugar dehydrogenase [Kaistia terrae]MCX5581192.1 PQQ-dependent sugar dehydrogenase [Kaistia terrae]